MNGCPARPSEGNAQSQVQLVDHRAVSWHVPERLVDPPHRGVAVRGVREQTGDLRKVRPHPTYCLDLEPLREAVAAMITQYPSSVVLAVASAARGDDHLGERHDGAVRLVYGRHRVEVFTSVGDRAGDAAYSIDVPRFGGDGHRVHRHVVHRGTSTDERLGQIVGYDATPGR